MCAEPSTEALALKFEIQRTLVDKFLGWQADIVNEYEEKTSL